MNIQTKPSRLRENPFPLPAEVDLPIRSVFLHYDNLRSLGEKIARSGFCDAPGLAPLDPQKRIAANAAKIQDVYRKLNAAQAAGETVTPAAQWLLDNYYLVEDTIYQVRRDLPRRFYRELPLLKTPAGEAPRALAMAWSVVAHTDSTVAPDLLKALVEGYQSVEPLKIGELWALPSLVRLVLVDNMRRLAQRVDRSREMRRIANQVADQVLAAEDWDERALILDDYAGHARDTTFASQLLFRLRDGSRNAGRALMWLENELERNGGDAEEIILAEHRTLSGGNVTAGNIIRGLRLINDTDWTVWFEDVSRVDALLRASTNFAALDFESRDQYRAAIEDLARRSGNSEYAVAEKAIALAEAPGAETGEQGVLADIGFFLAGPRRQELERQIGYRPRFRRRIGRLARRSGWLSLAAPILLVTLLALWLAGAGLAAMGTPAAVITPLLVLFALPATEAATAFVNTSVLLFLKPTRLVGFDYKDGVPPEARTLVVVPTLISSRGDVEESLRNLEVHYLANMRGAIHYALLSDWADSDVEQSPADLELLDYARSQIATLNARYPEEGVPRFHLLHRRRLFNEAQGGWMGWERKRGKLHELNLLLRGDADTTFLPPDSPLPDDVVYVMTLDADTRMTRDAVARLAGKLSHPLNRPHIDAAGRRVTSGYAILQPRITPSLTTGDEASFFQRVFSANRGIDPYVFTVSDVYQDVFGDGSFTGKGLYHIDAMEAALKGRIPENAVLSHDLLEGALARSALVTDVELVEDYPTRYAVDASRQHRWVRGDWQLLPFIFDPASGVPGLSRWKMADNLRRSLTPVFWVAAAVAGWALLPFASAAEWQFLLIISLFIAPTFDIVASLAPRDSNVTARGHFNTLGRDIAFGTAQVVLRIVLVADHAWRMADAIIRTLYRLFVSRRNLLEWRTASQAHQQGSLTLAGYYRMMRGAVVLGLVGLALPVMTGSSGVWVALVFSAFWIASPAFAWVISRSAETEDRLVVSPEDTAKLRNVARRTWLYFETFVTAEHHFLPPDNFQETPAPVVAHRTSPTNIGMYLLSILSARDFGWISLAGAVERIECTLATVEKLETHRGHLYNWYDTQTLQPLHPLYISSVDSGNLAGDLIAVAAACAEWETAPAAFLEGDFGGVLDAATVLEEALRDLPDDRRQLRPLRQRLKERINGIHRAIGTMKNEPETAAIRTINLAVLAGEARKLAAAIHHETKSAASEDLARWAEKLEETSDAHINDAHIDERKVDQLRTQLRDLAARARSLALRMDFSFLLREDRKLLSIGYRVSERQLDESCYDLLASEARLASLFAIAKGDVPTEHWFRLGRPIVHVGFGGALMSWSGSMFEYLMPPLVMKEPQGGLLNQTSKLVIRRQIQYARQKGIPWGISEAAYNARDREMTYQYTNFGVPGLGLKRGLAQNTVVAPYATALACQFVPHEAVTNLARLKAIGACGRYGYYDAVDFTPQRLPEGARRAVVQNYMAHHQGMTIVAIANAIFEGRMRDRFHSDPIIEAAELLLQEKAPRQIPSAAMRTEANERGKPEYPAESADTRLIVDPWSKPKAIGVMSNGHYSVMVTATGSGYSRFNEVAVTRWQPDPVEDRAGAFIFLRDVASGEWWSATPEPKQAPGESAYTIFSDDKASFFKTIGTLRSELECIVVSEANGEARRLTISNDGPHDRFIEVTSFAEIVLAPEAADNAHPAFSKMFVKTEIAGEGVIFAERRKRAPHEPDLALAHFVTDSSGAARETEAETDRRAFIGRGRSIANPAAFDPGARLSGSDGFVLDPVMALRRQVRIPANKKVTVTFWTLVGSGRTDVEAAIGRLDHPEGFQRQAMLAWTRSQVQTRYVGLSLEEAAAVQRLARYLVYPDPSLRLPGESFAAGLSQQSALWPTSISGDFPIFALRIRDVVDLEIVAKALRIQEYLRARGLLADLVIVNEQASSYVQDLQQVIEQLCENARIRGQEHGPRQHIFAVRRDLMDRLTYDTVLASARIVLHTRNGPIFDQIERAELAEEQRAIRDVSHAAAAAGPLPSGSGAKHSAGPRDNLAFWNGVGGFMNNGRDYVVRLEGDAVTPHPWINVVSNSGFGFHTSAEGASFTWSRNSRDFQLTPWSNDPVVNRPGEAIYIFDHATRSAFSPFAALARDPGAFYEARHGQGFSTFRAERGELAVEATQLLDPADPVKLTRLKIRNDGTQPARLRVYGYAEWVLGTNRSRTAPFILPARDGKTGALLARNAYSLDFADRTAFLASDGEAQSFTADRAEFIGRGSVWLPDAVAAGAELSLTVEAGRDPCAAIARDVEIGPGGEAELVFLLGDASSTEEASDLVIHHREKNFDERLAENEKAWRGLLDTLQVETPDKAFDAMVNHWLPYQALACRIRARSAFYQASGAFGFRDQLQDTLAFLVHDPSLARAQILSAASRQFPEGDVQHWWLPRSGAGVRTNISDDVVWLAYGVSEFIAVTGDASILDEETPFITGPDLKEGQHDAFFTPEVSPMRASIYEHCACALDLAVKRRGESGLPLILGGDWNDGMNRVGEGGRGTSVWLGWFLLKALHDFVPIAKSRGDRKRADRWQKHIGVLARALEISGWDGQWYRRGYFDDGSPLGSHVSEECRIDSIAQSWSVLSGHGEGGRSNDALNAAIEMLVDEKQRIVKLFTPPFDRTEKEPGYIKSYPPGVRENGGQYTHAATWLVIALARLGRADEAWRLFEMLNPVNHALDAAAAERYRVEPYVVAADIYSEGPLTGRGGWTWYTGSAGWLYRAAIEGILGIRKQGNALHLAPALPSHWPGFSATLRFGDAVYRFRVERGAQPGLMLNGKPWQAGTIPLLPNGEFDVVLTVANAG